MLSFGLIVLIAFMAILGWAIWQSQNKRPSPYTDISNAMPQPVVVIDVEMPFGSMVLFLVKLAMAAIPAMIMLAIIGWVIFSALVATNLAFNPAGRF